MGASYLHKFIYIFFIFYIKLPIYSSDLGEKLLLVQVKISCTFCISSPKENGDFAIQLF